MWAKVSELFLAKALLFIDADTVIGPDVNKGRSRFNHRIPNLGKAPTEPSAKGLIQSVWVLPAIA
jgi:hypothetical protein